MKGRRSLWWSGFCALALSLSTAAIGCGDDDTTDEGGTGGGGSSGSSGKPATAGKGGNAGSAGKGGSSGGGATPAMCVSSTTDLMKDQSGKLSAECISCICGENVAATTACNGNAMCWPLLQCVNTMCAGEEPTACAPNKCGTLLGGGGPAQAIGPVLQGAKCAAKCGGGTEDAGMNDAGL
jgi:hypothetical protein